MKKIAFICGAKDFHAMDKFRLTVQKLGSENVILLTDTIEGEGQQSKLLDSDQVFELFNIDKFTFQRQSKMANLWRNIVKLIFLPMQIFRIRAFYKNHTEYIYHAIPMYYMLLCKFARIEYIGTPQGSEILVRPFTSKIYAYFAKKALRASSKIIVDSINMQNGVRMLTGQEAVILKNGFNTSMLLSMHKKVERTKVISVRSMHPLYNIHLLLKARNDNNVNLNIEFIYPASEAQYLDSVRPMLKKDDLLIGRLERAELYNQLTQAKLVISIPYSDSSPRSVYESVFAGAAVVIQYSEYYDELPQCMKDRIILADLQDDHWLENAIIKANTIISKQYVPSTEAIEMCDENATIQKIISQIYYN